MGSATKETQEEFDQRQDQERAEQALPEGAVPEQRPVASQQIDPASESDAYRQEQEEGARDPMPKKAYDKASSDAQLKKAEKEEKKLGTEHLRVGDTVTITKKGPYKGAVGVVDSLEPASQDDAVKIKSGNPAVERFAKVSEYIVKTRAQGQRIPVKPDEVELFDRPMGVNVTDK